MPLQAPFSPRELQRFGMIGNSLDGIGIKHTSYPGMQVEPLMSGQVMLIFESNGWAVHDLWKLAGLKVSDNCFISDIKNDAKCVIWVMVIKIRYLFSSNYAANIEIVKGNIGAEESVKSYIGSLGAKNLESLFFQIKRLFNMNSSKLFTNTSDAMKYAS